MALKSYAKHRSNTKSLTYYYTSVATITVPILQLKRPKTVNRSNKSPRTQQLSASASPWTQVLLHSPFSGCMIRLSSTHPSIQPPPFLPLSLSPTVFSILHSESLSLAGEYDTTSALQSHVSWVRHTYKYIINFRVMDINTSMLRAKPGSLEV